MRLAAHFAGWYLLLAAVWFAMGQLQSNNWCSLPDWAGPGTVEAEYCSRPDPRSEVEKRPDSVSRLETMPTLDGDRAPGRRIVVRRLQ